MHYIHGRRVFIPNATRGVLASGFIERKNVTAYATIRMVKGACDLQVVGSGGEISKRKRPGSSGLRLAAANIIVKPPIDRPSQYDPKIVISTVSDTGIEWI